MTKKTSFGKMKTFSRFGVRYELLEFKKTGRAHVHSSLEYFKVLSGKGVLNLSGCEQGIQKGFKFCIPAKQLHYMRPLEGSHLKILLCYG